jgi:integrase
VAAEKILLSLDADGGSAHTGAVRVRAAYSERSTGELILGPPKSAAGVRAVTVPPVVADYLSRHLDEYVAAKQDALLFTGLKGQPVRRSNFGKVVSWTKTVADLGLPGLHFHDLRHTGNVLAAQTPGTTLRDLMARMGHDSMRAALIYQHLTRDADRHIADAIGTQIAREFSGSSDEHEDQDDAGSEKDESRG